VLPVLPCAASTLVTGVLGSVAHWSVAVRNIVSVHFETGDPAVPVVCVATQEAVRLPHTLVVTCLPEGPFVPRVIRWWTPPRLSGLTAPDPSSFARFGSAQYDGIDAVALLGRGAGLTPDGDDVLAGALVAGHATEHPMLPRWRRDTVRALASRRTTAVSVGMLHSALDGWAAPQLADAVEALCAKEPAVAEDAVARLLAVGHSSGRHLLDGVLHVLNTHPSRQQGAA
jgi:hypothetical protein